jgi:alpha-methylacyl-CoA racemase
VQAILGGKTRDEWSAIFAGHDCCVEPVLEPDELVEHPLHKAREVFFTIDAGDAGQVLQVRTPVGRAEASRLPPTLGQHSREVLAEYGFGDDEIAAILAPA